MIQLNGLTLAYIGDAYYELLIRRHFLDNHITKVNNLHQKAIQFTSAVNQAKAVKTLIDGFFSEAEIAVYKRGRNQSATHKPKNADIVTYNASTGFEAVIGYHYLNNNLQRIEDIMSEVFRILE